MLRKMKSAGKALKNMGTRSSSRLSSHQSEMSVDPMPKPAPSSSSGTRVKVLLKTGDLGLKTRREKEVFQQLKNKDFIHTPTLDPILLQETGTDTKFDLIFHMVGWTNFWNITELGSRLLTIEFLCTLQYYEGGIAFQMFHKWIGYNLFHCDNIRKVRVGDLQLIYAAINKVPISPATLSVAH